MFPQVLGSSLASSQSLVPSQYQLCGMQIPEVRQRNCLSEHWFGAMDGQPSSSEPSSQSEMPSHLYDSWMHCLRLLHLNWEPEQVMGGQSRSSALSKQSLSPSQTQDWGMQWPELSQVNWKGNLIVSG